MLTLTYVQLAWSPPVGSAPAGVAVQAPELQPLPNTYETFSLSVRPLRPLKGTLTGVAAGMGANITVMTDVHYPPAPQPIPPGMAGKGLKLAQAGTLWDIVGNTFGWKFTMALSRRDCAPFLPREGEGFEVLEPDPSLPGFYRAYPLEMKNPHWRDYGDPVVWPTRLHVEPRIPEPTGAVLAPITDNQDGTHSFATNPPLVNPGHWVGGELEVGEYLWTVVGFEQGNQVRILNSRRSTVTGEEGQAIIAPGSLFTFWPDIAIQLPNPPAIPPGQPSVALTLGVATADDKTYVPDKRSDPNRKGNEGHLSPALTVQRLDYNPPAAPPDVLGVPLSATPADFLSRSYFRVRFGRVNVPGTRYRVYRALADKGAGGQWAEPDVADYLLLTPEPVRADEEAYDDVAEKGYPNPSPAVACWKDTLDGKTQSAYYYVVRSESPAGLQSLPTTAIGPVTCPDVVPPAAPALRAAYGQEDAVRLEWSPSLESDLALYRVYRTTDAALAADPRSMELAAELPGPVLVNVGGKVRLPGGAPLPGGMGIATVHGVYKQADFDPAAEDLILGQTGTNWFNTLSGGDILVKPALPQDTPVVVLYTDVRGALNHSFAGQKESRTTLVRYVDGGRVPRMPYVYRVLALDTSGNVSAASAALTGQAYREKPPPEPDQPAFKAAWVAVTRGQRVQLDWGWQSPPTGLQIRIERSLDEDGPYSTVTLSPDDNSEWLPVGATTWLDRAMPGLPWWYRLEVRDAFGNSTRTKPLQAM